MDVLLRCCLAFLLVALTTNPTNYSFVTLAMTASDTHLPAVVLLGLVLLAAWVVFVHASVRSLGLFGMALVAAIVAALVWVLIDFGWLTLGNRAAREWVGIVALSVVLGFGLSWSQIRRHLTGVVDTREVDEQ